MLVAVPAPGLLEPLVLRLGGLECLWGFVCLGGLGCLGGLVCLGGLIFGLVNSSFFLLFLVLSEGSIFSKRFPAICF